MTEISTWYPLHGMSVSQLMPLKESNFRHHAGYEKCKSWVGMKSQTPKHVKNTLSKPETNTGPEQKWHFAKTSNQKIKLQEGVQRSKGQEKVCQQVPWEWKLIHRLKKKHPGFVRICSNQGKTVALQLLDVAHGFAVKLARDTPRTHQEIHQGSCVKIKR